MVVALGPGKFYGSSLPRPRIYTDVKFNSDRVDPPVPVMDPLLSWAEEAHWSMGGLSFTRLRLQGRIEGNANRLRKQIEKQAKLKSPAAVSGRVRANGKGMKKEARSRSGSESPPPAPMVTKRRRFVDNFEEESEEEEIESPVVEAKKRRKLTRKLAADFEKAADRTPVSARTRSRAAGEAGSNGGAAEGEGNRAVEVERKRKPARKLVTDFEKVADVGVKTKRKSPEKSGGAVDPVMKIVEELNKENSAGKKVKASKQSSNGGESKSRSSPANSVRSSPRLAKKT